MRNALRTLRLHRAAWQLLGGPLAWWFLPAALVTLVLSALGWWGIGALAEHLADRWLPEEEWRHAPGWLAALVEVSIWMVLLVLKLKVTKYIMLLLLGPVLGMVSEAVDVHLGAKPFPYSWRLLVNNAWRGMHAVFWMACLEMVVGLSCWAVAWAMPVLSPLMLALSWTVGAWAYGAAMLDYVWEREGLGAKAGLVRSVEHLGIALGVGVPFSIWMSVPVVAWTLGPLMGGMGAATVAVLAVRRAQPASPATT